MKDKLILRLGFYFPWTFRIPAVVGLGLCIVLILENTWASIGGMILCLLVLTSHYGFELDRKSKEYKDYLWLFGYKKGAIKPYSEVDHLGIILKKISRTYNSRGSTSTIVHEEYEGYILFSGEEKIELYSSNSKKKVERKLSGLSDFLEIPVRDSSE